MASDLVDQLHWQPPFNFKPCALWDDFQQGFAGTHHRTFGVHAQIDGDAIRRRQDGAVLQTETGRGQLLLKGKRLDLGIGPLAAHLFLVLLALLLKAQARLDDTLLYTSGFACVLRQALLHLRKLTLELQQAIAGNEPVLRQRLQVTQLLAQRISLSQQVRAGTAHAGELQSGTLDARLQAGLLARQGLASAAEQLPLPFKHQRQPWVGVLPLPGGNQLCGKAYLVKVVALALPTRQAGPGHSILSSQRLHVSFDLSLIKAKQRFALFDQLTFTDQNFADHTAIQRLHGLAFARHHHRPLHGNALIQRGKTGPKKETARPCQHENPAGANEELHAALLARHGVMSVDRAVHTSDCLFCVPY